MTEAEALARMIAPGQPRPLKAYRQGVIQIHITRACDKACNNCTQGAELAGKVEFMSPAHFEQAVLSLKGYFGVIGVFGGNPALSPHFPDYCETMRRLVPLPQRGIWCNHPRTLANAVLMRETFDPSVSNLNVHLDKAAYDLFKQGWPECNPVGLSQDSRHSPVHLAMKDVLWKICPECHGESKGLTLDKSGILPPTVANWVKCPTCRGAGHIYDEARAWELISDCDINKNWSALIGVFRGELRAWFCEVAGAQAILHQHEPDYPDTGLELWCDPNLSTPGIVKGGGIQFPWWRLQMPAFAHQVRKHCHECSVPLRGHGELAMVADGTEQTSATHAGIFKPKRPGRKVEVVTTLEQLGMGRITRATDYLGNVNR